MQSYGFGRTFIKAFGVMAIGIGSLGAAEAGSQDGADSPSGAKQLGGAGSLGLIGDAGFYTYGMNDVNARFRDGRDADFSGGLALGAGLKFGLTDQVSLRVSMDYLEASREAHRTIQGIDYATRVRLPATLVFLGGELVFLPLGPLNIKAIGGYTLVNIHNGREEGREGPLDLGAITGSGSGFQAGLGAELFLVPSLSVGAELGYNYAKIEGATFAGGPADPGSVNRTGTVDYSGVMAKVAVTLYLMP